jgi:hypothetical protein
MSGISNVQSALSYVDVELKRLRGRIGMSENGILEPNLMTEIREMAVIVDAFIPEFSAKIRHPSSNTVGEWYSYVDEIEARRGQACDETISPMSRAATVILHRLESERSLTQLATNVQASGTAVSLPLKSAAGQYLDSEKDLLSRAPGIGQARWHTIDDLPDASKAFSQDVSAMYRLSRDNPVVLRQTKTFNTVAIGAPVAPAYTQFATPGFIDIQAAVAPDFRFKSCTTYLTFGYAQTAVANVDHDWAITLPAGVSSMRVQINKAYVVDTGVVIGDNADPALNVTVDGQAVVNCGTVVTIVRKSLGPSSVINISGTPSQSGGDQAYAYSLVLLDPEDNVGNGVSETSIGATLASRSHNHAWAPNDVKMLSIVSDYERFMLLKDSNFQPFYTGLESGAIAIGPEAYDFESWIHNPWNFSVSVVNRLFVKFARRVNVALRLAALDCEFGQEQGVG